MDNQTNNPTPEVTPEAQPAVNPGEIRKSTTRGILSALQAATGQQFNSVEEMIAWSARANQVLTAQPAPAPAPVVTKDTGKDTGMAAVQAQLAAMQEAMARKDAQLRERDTESQIMSSLGDQFEPELQEFVVSKVKANIKYDNDRMIIVDANGNTRYNLDNGQPLGIKDLVAEIGKQYPKTLKQTQVPGSGPGFRAGNSQIASAAVPDYASDPAAFKMWAESNGLGKRNTGMKGKLTTNVSSSLKR